MEITNDFGFWSIESRNEEKAFYRSTSTVEGPQGLYEAIYGDSKATVTCED